MAEKSSAPAPDLPALGADERDERVIHLADADLAEDLAAMAGQTVGLTDREALALLLARAELPAALLCRALGMTADGYSAVLRMRHRRRRDGRTLPSALLSAYGGIVRPTTEELRRQVAALGDQPDDYSQVA